MGAARAHFGWFIGLGMARYPAHGAKYTDVTGDIFCVRACRLGGNVFSLSGSGRIQARVQPIAARMGAFPAGDFQQGAAIAGARIDDSTRAARLDLRLPASGDYKNQGENV